jgi:excisionase family DNA binding protein
MEGEDATGRASDRLDDSRNKLDDSHNRLDRLTTAEAARRLGITEGAVRKRAQRGKIPHEHDEAGR